MTFPEVKSRIERIVLMGGSVTRGNKGVMAGLKPPRLCSLLVFSMATLDAGWELDSAGETAQQDMGKVGLMAHDLFRVTTASAASAPVSKCMTLAQSHACWSLTYST